MGKIRLTMAQALVRFLDNQYLLVDGVETKFVKGIFAIFGHGNVLGLGQALEQDSGELVGDTVVATVMSNLGFLRAMESAGIAVEQTKVGDRYVFEALKAGGFALGGE